MAQISYDTLTITNIPDNLRQNFWVETTNYSSQIPAGVYITQNSASSFKNNPSGPNIFIQATNNNNGIRLRQGLLTLAEIMSDRFRLYTPNGSTQGLLGLSLDATDGLVLYRTNNAAVEKGLQLSSAGLEIFGSSQSTADVTVDSSGIKLIKGGIEAGTKNTTDYIYVCSNDDSNHSITIGNSTAKTDWRIVAGNKFGVDKAGNVYATSADITGIIKANEGSIGGANGWTISSQEIKSTNYDITDSGSIYLSTKDLTTATTINGQSRTDWRFTIGDKFGVTKDGYLYANGSFITDITAESLNIGPVVKYYVCDTAAATQAKTIDNVSNFTLTIGMVINVTFTYGNTNSQPTLNINNTGAKSIMKPSSSGATNLSYYEYNFATSNTVRTFRYDGTYWVLQDDGAGNARSSASSAAYTAYDYITKIDNAGIFISPYNQSPSTSSPGNSIKIDGSGMKIYKGGIAIAQYGESAIIGKESAAHSVIDANGQRFYGSNGTTQLANIGYGSGTSQSGTAIAPYYTFGIRVGNIGNWSVAEGYGVDANGFASHAEGGDCTAHGSYSHAEGGETTANGPSSHSEGIYTLARGSGSHAGGCGTIADGLAQTAIGSYNAIDPNYNANKPENKAKYVFVIGNGTGNTTADRSNALTVDWNGNVNIASGAEYQINGSPHTHTTLTHSSISIQTTSYTSVTIAANSYKVGEVTCPTVTNFAPRCIVGWNWSNQTSSQSGETIPFFSRVFVDQTEKKVYFTARNCTSSQITTSARFFILYTQNS